MSSPFAFVRNSSLPAVEAHAAAVRFIIVGSFTALARTLSPIPASSELRIVCNSACKASLRANRCLSWTMYFTASSCTACVLQVTCQTCFWASIDPVSGRHLEPFRVVCCCTSHNMAMGLRREVLSTVSTSMFCSAPSLNSSPNWHDPTCFQRYPPCHSARSSDSAGEKSSSSAGL